MNKKQMQKLINMQLGNMHKSADPRRRKIYTRNKFYYDIGEIINNWNVEDLKEFVKTLLTKNSKTFSWFKNQLFPMEMVDLHYDIFMSKHTDIKKMLIWYALLISNNKEQINKYVAKKKEFEVALINGRYDGANASLSEIEKLMGYSFWSIDSRLALYEYSIGLEKNKEYLEEISLSSGDAWVKVCADFFSFKAEKSVNNRQYVHRVQNFLEQLTESIRPFFEEKLFPIIEINEDEIANILRLNSSASLIDMYNVFIKVCIRILSDDHIQNSQLIKLVSEALSLVNGIEDIVLYKLKWSCDSLDDDICLSEKDMEFLTIGDLYTKGEYETVIEKIDSIIEDNADCFELYEYYVKSHIMLNRPISLDAEEKIKDQLMLAMYCSYIKDGESDKAYFLLSRLLRLFSNSNLGTTLANFFADKYMIGISDILQNGKEYVSPIINIKLMNAVKSKGHIVLNVFKEHIDNSPTIDLYEYLFTEDKTTTVTEIDSMRSKWYAIKKDILFGTGNPVEVLKNWYFELKDKEGICNSYQKERIATELYYLYIARGLYLEAEELVVDETISNRYSTIRMDLECIFCSATVKNKKMKSNICTPIATFLYKEGDYTSIYGAVANFLNMNGVKKPSELFQKESVYGETRLYFFLKRVCVKEVLDSMYSVFETDEEVENERIEICKYLQVHDKKHVSEYIEEISQIMQDRKIIQGVKYFEDVKIDVDFDKIHTVYGEVFEEDYKRFCQIDKLDNNYTTFDALSNKWYIYVNAEQQTFSHALLVFKEFFEDYRQELAFGKYGLDPILGTRIRHGCLQNQIRVAFENNNIAFVCRSAEDRTYLPTKVFEGMCVTLSQEAKNKLYEVVSAFSRDIDDYMEEITTEYIRIKIDEKNPKGLFDFSVKLEDIALLMQMVKEYQNVNLVCELFEIYWVKRLENSLSRAREFFEQEVKNKFISRLKRLEEDVTKITIGEQVHDILLDSISRTRTELQKGMNYIVEWFKLPQREEIEDYSANDLIETCELINRRVVSNYDEIEKDVVINVNSLFRGKTFTHMIDILIILFTNAFYHSGYIDNLSDLVMNFEMTETDNDIILKVQNNLAEFVNKRELKETVLDIQQKLEECIKNREYYNYEGKSGYIKICKILECNLSCQSYMEFGLTAEENAYYVMIKMPKCGMIRKEVENESVVD